MAPPHAPPDPVPPHHPPPAPQVKPRKIGGFFFSDRSPTITVKQSFAIVKALQIMGLIDKNGWLKDDPRVGQAVRARLPDRLCHAPHGCAAEQGCTPLQERAMSCTLVRRVSEETPSSARVPRCLPTSRPALRPPAADPQEPAVEVESAAGGQAALAAHGHQEAGHQPDAQRALRPLRYL